MWAWQAMSYVSILYNFWRYNLDWGIFHFEAFRAKYLNCSFCRRADPKLSFQCWCDWKNKNKTILLIKAHLVCSHWAVINMGTPLVGSTVNERLDQLGEFDGCSPRWSGAGALALWEKAEASGLVLPGEKAAAEAPNSSHSKTYEEVFKMQLGSAQGMLA